VKTSTWGIITWNRAASVVLVDYGPLVAEQRNILRLMFCNRIETWRIGRPSIRILPGQGTRPVHVSMPTG
jgi:hypothetical protein